MRTETNHLKRLKQIAVTCLIKILYHFGNIWRDSFLHCYHSKEYLILMKAEVNRNNIQSYWNLRQGYDPPPAFLQKKAWKQHKKWNDRITKDRIIYMKTVYF